jgi:hypothetical protein
MTSVSQLETDINKKKQNYIKSYQQFQALLVCFNFMASLPEDHNFKLLLDVLKINAGHNT